MFTTRKDAFNVCGAFRSMPRQVMLVGECAASNDPSRLQRHLRIWERRNLPALRSSLSVRFKCHQVGPPIRQAVVSESRRGTYRQAVLRLDAGCKNDTRPHASVKFLTPPMSVCGTTAVGRFRFPVAAGQSVLRQLRQPKQTSTVGRRWAAVEAYPTPTAGRGNLHGPPQSLRPAAPIARATRR